MPPTISTGTKKIYGSKTFSDDQGSYVLQDQVIGEEKTVEVKILFRDGLTQQLVDAALRHSPFEAITSHLRRLAVHKVLGSNVEDRAILLHDYANALKAYSDFIVFTACKHFWENDPNQFYPKIAVLQTVCEEIHQSVKNVHAKFLPSQTSESKQDKYNLSQWFAEPKENPKRREICDFLLSKGEPDYFDSASYSNYQLETMAKSRFGWGKEGEELARNLNAG